MSTLPEVVPMVLDHGKQTLSPAEPLSHGDCIGLNRVGIPMMYRGELARLRAENERLEAERDEARALLVRVNDHTGFSVFSDPLPVEVLHYVAAHCE